jgi:hypothetical protein
MLIGTDGVYSFTFQHQQRPDCPVCGGESLDIAISKEWTVDRLIETLVERQDMYGVHPRFRPHRADVHTARSRSRRCPPARRRSTFKLRRSSSRQRDRIWRRRCQSSSRTVGTLSSQRRRCRSTSACGSPTRRTNNASARSSLALYSAIDFSRPNSIRPCLMSPRILRKSQPLGPG